MLVSINRAVPTIINTDSVETLLQNEELFWTLNYSKDKIKSTVLASARLCLNL